MTCAATCPLFVHLAGATPHHMLRVAGAWRLASAPRLQLGASCRRSGRLATRLWTTRSDPGATPRWSWTRHTGGPSSTPTKRSELLAPSQIVPLACRYCLAHILSSLDLISMRVLCQTSSLMVQAAQQNGRHGGEMRGGYQQQQQGSQQKDMAHSSSSEVLAHSSQDASLRNNTSSEALRSSSSASSTALGPAQDFMRSAAAATAAPGELSSRGEPPPESHRQQQQQQLGRVSFEGIGEMRHVYSGERLNRGRECTPALAFAL